MEKPVVNLVKYDNNWETQFEMEKNQIEHVLGSIAKSIQHIGSTSVKGLTAKPIIDMMVGVSNLDEDDELVIPLSSIQYEYVPKLELKDRRFFRKGLWGKGTCHLHICEFESNEWNEIILFRDYLRNHPDTAFEYESLKKDLAVKYQFDRPAYTKAKEPFIRAVIKKAMLQE